MRVVVTFQQTRTHQAVLDTEDLDELDLSDADDVVRELLTAELLERGGPLGWRVVGSQGAYPGHKLSELLWGLGHEIDHSSTRVIAAHKKGD